MEKTELTEDQKKEFLFGNEWRTDGKNWDHWRLPVFAAPDLEDAFEIQQLWDQGL